MPKPYKGKFDHISSQRDTSFLGLDIQSVEKHMDVPITYGCPNNGDLTPPLMCRKIWMSQ